MPNQTPVYKARVQYIADGVQKIFSFTFPYLALQHIKVYVNKQLVTHGKVSGTGTGGTVTFDIPPIKDYIIVIVRETPTTPLVKWQDGSRVSENDMNLEETQLFYCMEETQDSNLFETEGKVRSVNNKLPDALGDIKLAAVDVGAVKQVKSGNGDVTVTTDAAGVATVSVGDVTGTLRARFLVIEMGAHAGGFSTAAFKTPTVKPHAVGDVLKAKDIQGNTEFGTLTKKDVGLSNVDDTSDLDKPLSIAARTALDGKADTLHTHDVVRGHALTIGVNNSTALTVDSGGTIVSSGQILTAGNIESKRFFYALDYSGKNANARAALFRNDTNGVRLGLSVTDAAGANEVLPFHINDSNEVVLRGTVKADHIRLPVTNPPGAGYVLAATDTDGNTTWKQPSLHSHVISDVASLQTTLDGKWGTAVVSPDTKGLCPAMNKAAAGKLNALTVDEAGVIAARELTFSVSWKDVLDKPTTYPPSVHSHVISDVASLQTTLDGKASTTHAHIWNDISDVPANVTNLANGTNIVILPSGYIGTNANMSAAAGITSTELRIGTRPCLHQVGWKCPADCPHAEGLPCVHTPFNNLTIAQSGEILTAGSIESKRFFYALDYSGKNANARAALFRNDTNGVRLGLSVTDAAGTNEIMPICVNDHNAVILKGDIITDHMRMPKANPVAAGYVLTATDTDGNTTWKQQAGVDTEARAALETICNMGTGTFTKDKAYLAQRFMMGSMINVLDHELDHTGTTCCADALNKIIAENTKGLPLYFPYGTYAFEKNIVFSKDLIIAGEYYHAKMMSKLLFKAAAKAQFECTAGAATKIIMANVHVTADTLHDIIKNPAVTCLVGEHCYLMNPVKLTLNALTLTSSIIDTSAAVTTLYLDAVHSKRKLSVTGQATVINCQLYDQGGTGSIMFSGTDKTSFEKSQCYNSSFVGGIASETEQVTIRMFGCVGNVTPHKITSNPSTGYTVIGGWLP